jgi:Ti-type conjugative transfer relaxase TraA
MAIYHLSVKVISRAAGRSSVAAAAYRSASRLHDERLDRTHDFTNKSGVVHSEVMLPETASGGWQDREQLWNDIERIEVRKDAQLAREVEFAIPREMNEAQGIELARDFVQSEFVDAGMIADLNVHWDIGADGQAKPHAHVMVTMREIVIDKDGETGFGAKVREWNRTELVEQWRERWAGHVNTRLAELDIDARIDHRSLEAQGIALEPQDKIGGAASRMEDRGLEAERIEQHREIAARNGQRIIVDPRVALDAITHQQATFTNRDLAMFVHRHSDGREQYDAVMGAVRASPELVELGKDGRGEDRFTSRDMIETEQRLQRAAEIMAERERHRVSDADREGALARALDRGFALSSEQRTAFDHVTGARDLDVVIGYAGTGKSAMLGAAREAWESAGLEVRGAALSGIAAEGLENGSGIASRTIASMEHGWAQGRDLLTSRDVLVIDEAGMVGTRQMERVLSHAAEAGAKVVLVGDPQQLQAIEAGAALRTIHEQHGGVEITEIRRQQEGWQQDATRHLATGRTGEAIEAYASRDMVHAAETREAARGELIERWDRERQARPDASRIILTHTNDEVRLLNEAARGAMREGGDLGMDVAIEVERGDRMFASGDRIMFLKNERSMEVKNGTLGVIERVSAQRMAVRTDDGRSVAFDVKQYRDLDHGYAATFHKAQGVSADRSHLLATPGMDRHSAYVGMTRHRDGIAIHYGRDDFKDQGRLVQSLSRDRPKDMASDYAKADPARAIPERVFAERRGIAIRERVAKIVKQVVPEKVRGMFDGLRLAMPAVPRAPEKESIAPRHTALAPAIERHARAVDAIWKMEDKGLPILPHQREALEKARAALDATGKEHRRDWEAVCRHNPALVAEAASGRTQGAIRAMRLEAEVRVNPELRADRFVERWQGLNQQRSDARQRGDRSAQDRIGKSMGAMADGLHRDPQMESVLQNRRQQLGLKGGGISMPEVGIGRELANSIGIGKDRGIGIGM